MATLRQTYASCQPTLSLLSPLPLLHPPAPVIWHDFPARDEKRADYIFLLPHSLYCLLLTHSHALILTHPQHDYLSAYTLTHTHTHTHMQNIIALLQSEKLVAYFFLVIFFLSITKIFKVSLNFIMRAKNVAKLTDIFASPATNNSLYSIPSDFRPLQQNKCREEFMRKPKPKLFQCLPLYSICVCCLWVCVCVCLADVVAAKRLLLLLLVFVALFAGCWAPGVNYFVCVGVTHTDTKYFDSCMHVCVFGGCVPVCVC